MCNTNFLSDLLKTGLAVITLISEENWWQFFLHIVLRCLANHKNGKFTNIMKSILWDFDKKSVYFLARLYVSTARAIAVTTASTSTPASAMLKMLKLLVKVFKSLYLLNLI